MWAGGSVSTLAFFPRETSVVVANAPVPESAGEQRSELERFMETAPRVPLAVPNEGAKVLIVKFADYQCPACGQAYQSYKPILAKVRHLEPDDGEDGAQGLPAEHGVQQHHAHGAASGGLRGQRGGVRPLARAPTIRVTSWKEVVVPPAGDDARYGGRNRRLADRWRHRLRREVSGDPWKLVEELPRPRQQS